MSLSDEMRRKLEAAGEDDKNALDEIADTKTKPDKKPDTEKKTTAKKKKKSRSSKKTETAKEKAESIAKRTKEKPKIKHPKGRAKVKRKEATKARVTVKKRAAAKRIHKAKLKAEEAAQKSAVRSKEKHKAAKPKAGAKTKRDEAGAASLKLNTEQSVEKSKDPKPAPKPERTPKPSPSSKPKQDQKPATAVSNPSIGNGETNAQPQGQAEPAAPQTFLGRVGAFFKPPKGGVLANMRQGTADNAAHAKDNREKREAGEDTGAPQKDIGVSALSGAAKAIENTAQMGVSALEKGASMIAPFGLGDKSPKLSDKTVPILGKLNETDNAVSKKLEDTGMVSPTMETFAQFSVGLIGPTKIASAMKLKGGTKALAVGAGADASAFDGHDTRLSDFAQELGVENEVTDYLASDDEDGELEGRLKNAVEGAGIGIAAGAAVKMLKLVKSGKPLEEAVKDPEVDAAITQSIKEADAAQGRTYSLDDTDKAIVSQFLANTEEGTNLRHGIAELEQPLIKAKAATTNIERMVTDGKSADVLFEMATAVETHRPKGVRGFTQVEKNADREFLKDAGWNVERFLKVAAAKAEHVKDLDSFIHAGKRLQVSLAENAAAKAREMQELGKHKITPEMAAEFKRSLAALASVKQQVDGTATEAARATAAGRILKSSGGNISGREIDDILANEDPNAILQTGKEFLEVYKRNPAKAIGALNKGLYGKVNKYGTAPVMQVFINSILGNAKTQVVNLAGGSLFTAVRPLERMVGSAMALDKKEFAAAAAEMASFASHSVDSAKMAFEALKAGRGTLDPKGSKFDETMDAVRYSNGDDKFNAVRGVGYELADKVASEGSAANKAVRATAYATNALYTLPSTHLMASTDEFVKQISYRSTITGDALREGMEQGLKGKELNEFRDAYFREKMDELESGQADEAALQVARENTFQQSNSDLVTRSVNSFIAKHPMAQALVPFANTTSNLLKTSASYVPGLNLATRGMEKRLYQELTQGGKVGAQARGRMAASVAYTSALTAFAMQGKLQGNGPSDFKAHKTMERAGEQPNSIKVGDDWHSLARLAPYSLNAKIVGGVSDLYRYSDFGDEEMDEQVKRGMSELVVVLTDAARTESFASSMSETLSLVSEGESRDVRKFLSGKTSRVIPPMWKEVSDLFDGSVEGNTIKAAVSHWEKTIKHAPFAGNKLSDVYDPVMGEKFKRPDGKFSPIQVRRTNDDPVAKELLKFKKQFSYVPPKLKHQGGSITLNSEQYSEYTRLIGQIGRSEGADFHSELKALFKSEKYRDAYIKDAKGNEIQPPFGRNETPPIRTEDYNWNKDPRQKMVNKIWLKRRKLALSALLETYPELQETLKADAERRLGLRPPEKE